MDPQLDLHPEKILELEFEYARDTAMQAQNDRTVVVNLYLILVGATGSLLLAGPALTAARGQDIPTGAFAVLFSLLALIGFLTFLKLIRLRQAWQDSALVMNAIKDYYLKRFPELDVALRWQTASLPALGKPLSITFILALMIALIDSFALAAAIDVLRLREGTARIVIDLIAVAFGLVFQALVYFYQLSGSAVPDQSSRRPTGGA